MSVAFSDEDWALVERAIGAARRAAGKLETMYARGECAHVDEVDVLIEMLGLNERSQRAAVRAAMERIRQYLEQPT
jgi:hypothetical protein